MSSQTATLPVRQRPAYRRFEPSRVIGAMTVEEYLDFLDKAEQKYDYVHGEVVEVSGASLEHNLIAMNFAVTTRIAFEAAQSTCEVLGSDQRVYVRDDLHYFPDLMIVCGEIQADHRDALRNPAAIVEVLSSSTEINDRSDKFREYQQIASLQHYVLIDQYRISVTHYTKLENGLWAVVADYRSLTDSVTLTFDTTISIPLHQIYRRVSFSEE